MQDDHQGSRAVTRTSIWRGGIHVQIQIDEFEKKSVMQNMNA